jgi:SAM-dependent methyltransferase
MIQAGTHDHRERPGESTVMHREEEYDSRAFALLRRMQLEHFWYRGRHRFLLRAVKRAVGRQHARSQPLSVIDLGGGCGGWIDYLKRSGCFLKSEVALADSSETALGEAAHFLPAHVTAHQVDLLNLPWRDRWDVAFLLDVLEHIPDDARALDEIHRALVPGGLLFVTVPALDQFWSWNDEFCRHRRRYSRPGLVDLANTCGFNVLDARYFMFFLSPLLLASRFLTDSKARSLSESQRRSLAMKMHEVPNSLVNGVLSVIFACETPIGHLLHFPWGTSLLAVLEKPSLGGRLAIA